LSRISPTSRKKATTATKRTVNPAQAATEALKSYEEALKVFKKGDYSRAISQFEAIVKEYPGEREICDRSRTWVAAAKARLASLPAAKTPDEHYYRGVLAANDGRLDEAATSFQAAVSQDPRSDRSHYALAALRGMRGESSAAVSHLTKAIEINPSNRVRALNDADFDTLRDDAEFMSLLGKRTEV
jgi:TolA-binding protein